MKLVIDWEKIDYLHTIFQKLGLDQEQSKSLMGLLKLTLGSKKVIDNPKKILEWIKCIAKENLSGTGSTKDKKDPSLILHFLDEIGLISEIVPKKTKYNHVILISENGENIVLKLKYLKKIWEQGVRFDKIFLLGCDANLDPFEEGYRVGYTQMEYLKYKLEVEKETWPADLKQVAIKPIYVQEKTGECRDCSVTSIEKIHSWLRLKPNPGSVLLISKQPYVLYHHNTVKNALPGEFEFETVGPEAVKDEMLINKSLAIIYRLLDEMFPYLRKL
jgi:hypothetical protein